MKACMLAYTFYEQDNRVMRYAETLAQRGDQVDVICLRYGEQRSFETINGVEVIRIQTREKNERNRRTYLWRLLLFSLRAVVVLSWRHLRHRYDLIHVHSMPDFLVFSAIVPRITGCPIILDIHDLLPELYTCKFKDGSGSQLNRLLLIEERLSVAFASHVIIPNPLWEERLLKRSIFKGGCTVIINAPDRAVFQARSATEGEEEFIMLYPGSLNWHQGLDLAIQAVNLIRDRVPRLEFHICGAGSELHSLRRLVCQLDLESRVRFLEPRPILEIATLMRRASLGIVPKRRDSFGNEAFSTKILEFMAVGVPVLVSDTKIDRYYFTDSIVQFCDSADVEKLAQEIIALVEQPERRKQLVKNALGFVRQNDWNANRDRYLDLVDGLIRKCSASRSVPAPLPHR